jgi:NAD(P)-dependent dehydrogenase (short-subunit alcohol dehydrogenase family)
MRLKGKLAVITAAASGMGRAGVELFAREGATVAAVDINATALKVVVGEANAKGGKVVPVVSDPPSKAYAKALPRRRLRSAASM